MGSVLYKIYPVLRLAAVFLVICLQTVVLGMQLRDMKTANLCPNTQVRRSPLRVNGSSFPSSSERVTPEFSSLSPSLKKSTGGERIVGGVVVDRCDMYPFVCSILITGPDGKTYLCTGILIALNLVLTAAHCCLVGAAQGIQPSPETKFEVFSGGIQVGKGQARMAIEATVHPKFNTSTLSNDYCFLLLNSSFPDYDNCIKPIDLACDNYNLPHGKTVYAVGFGAIDFFGLVVDDKLRYILLKIVDYLHCKSCYEAIGLPVDPLTMLCAGDVDKDACSGDSGGPLFVNDVDNNRKRFLLVGVVSWGFFCGLYPLWPGVYARIAVAAFCNFVNCYTNGAITCSCAGSPKPYQQACTDLLNPPA